MTDTEKDLCFRTRSTQKYVEKLFTKKLEMKMQIFDSRVDLLIIFLTWTILSKIWLCYVEKLYIKHENEERNQCRVLRKVETKIVNIN